MTAPVPAAPMPVTAKRRVIRQSKPGWLLGWIGAASGSLLPWIMLERAVGVDGRLVDQAWIIPVGLLGVSVTFGAYRWTAPQRARAELIVTPGRLEYRDQGAAPVVVDRARIGLIDVTGSGQNGAYIIIVHDHQSTEIVRWTPRWAGWVQERVVKVLRAAGYPAALHRDIYDGRFQSQTVGRPPRTVADGARG